MKLVECVPNFSEGRRPEVILELRRTIESVPGVVLLDTESDPDHNRSVFTFVGTPESALEAAFLATKKAAELIDLNQHEGEHPRIGATDVIPFIPIEGVTMEDCVQLAETLGERIARELGIPVYLYGEAARVPERKDLAHIRRGQFEGLKEAIKTDPSRKPDFGPPELHPTAGATVVGARKFLIAYNVNLGTDNLSIARKIARRVRAKHGGLAFVKALGFNLEDRGQVQVSMNLVDYEYSPVFAAYELVKLYADRYGVPVVGSEVVGLIPEKALFDVADFYLKLENFQPDQTVEARIRKHFPPELTFLLDVAADTPVPGGGSVSAYSLAQGYALLHMVLGISVRSKKTREYHDALRQHRREVFLLLGEAHRLVREDAEAFQALQAAYRIKREEPGRKEKIEEAALHAMEVPLEVMRKGRQGLELARQLLGRVSPYVISDVGVAAEQFGAAIRGAHLNVLINRPDAGEGGQPLVEEAEQIVQASQQLLSQVTERIRSELAG